MDERSYEGDLRLDPIATQRRGGGQSCDQVETLRKLSGRFNQSGTLQRPLSGFAPKTGGLFDQPGLGAVAGQNLRLVLGDVSETAFEGFGDTSVQRTSRLAIGRILNETILRLASVARTRAIGRCGYRAQTDNRTLRAGHNDCRSRQWAAGFLFGCSRTEFRLGKSIALSTIDKSLFLSRTIAIQDSPNMPRPECG
jgi:hypothetical protein